MPDTKSDEVKNDVSSDRTKHQIYNKPNLEKVEEITRNFEQGES